MSKQSLYQALLRNEQQWADKVYLKQPKQEVWHEWTWAQVMRQARQVASFLHDLGLSTGSHVAIISKNCAEWFVIDFGIHLAGMVNVPLFANQQEESIHYVLEHAEIKLVFIGKLDDHARVREYIPSAYPTVNIGYHPALSTAYQWTDVLAHEPLQETIEPDPNGLYTIIYTSGTTGMPKGAMYTNQAIADYLSIFPEDLQRICQRSHYHLVSYLPLAHVYERSAIELGSIVASSDVSFIESLDKFAENLQQIKPTLFTAVPRIWGVFQQKVEQRIAPKVLACLLCIPGISHLIRKKIIKSLGFNACTNAFSGASHLPASIIRFFNRLGIRIQEGYGQTENMAYVTISRLDDLKLGYVGTPRLGVSIKLDASGELLMKGPCMMAGYFKNEEATQKSFTADGWLRTGDLAVIDTQKRVKILGRISENFKNQTGEFIAPTPIEKKFESKNTIAQLCLVGQGLPHNILLVGLTEKALRKDREDIKKYLSNRLRSVNKKLAKYEKISTILVVSEVWSIENGMLTPTFKVKRKVVEAYYADAIQQALIDKHAVIWL